MAFEEHRTAVNSCRIEINAGDMKEDMKHFGKSFARSDLYRDSHVRALPRSHPRTAVHRLVPRQVNYTHNLEPKARGGGALPARAAHPRVRQPQEIPRDHRRRIV
jgi:hypothetical protein